MERGGVITTQISHAASFSQDAIYMMHSMIAHEIYNNQHNKNKNSRPKSKDQTIDTDERDKKITFCPPLDSSAQKIKHLSSNPLSGKTLLHYGAAIKNDLEKFSQNVAQHSHDINCCDRNGDTSLHITADNNNVIGMFILLKNKAHQDIKNVEQYTPLAITLTNRLMNASLLLIQHQRPQKHPRIVYTTKTKNKGLNDPFYTFKSTSPQREYIISNYNAEHLLFEFIGTSPHGEKITQDYKFIVPIHAELLHQRLRPLYKEQLRKEITAINTVNFDKWNKKLIAQPLQTSTG